MELEAALTTDRDDRRIDVLTWRPGQPESRIAIEVQASDITLEAIEARTASYARLGAAPLWLRLLDFAEFARVQTLPLRGTVWIERYRARAWERWAHDHLGGRLWFMDAETGFVWRGLFVAAHRARERGGGRGADWTEARRWVDLELEGPFALAELKLSRGAVTAEGKRRPFARFVPPDQATERPPFPPRVRVEFIAETVGESRDMRVEVEGVWIVGPVEGARSDWRTRRLEPRPALTALPGKSRRDG